MSCGKQGEKKTKNCRRWNFGVASFALQEKKNLLWSIFLESRISVLNVYNLLVCVCLFFNRAL